MWSHTTRSTSSIPRPFLAEHETCATGRRRIQRVSNPNRSEGGQEGEGGKHGSRGVQQRRAAEQRTGAGGDRVAHVEADHLLDLAEHALGVRAREVDLVEDLRRAHAARERAARVRK